MYLIFIFPSNGLVKHSDYNCRHLFSKCISRFCSRVHQGFGKNQVSCCFTYATSYSCTYGQVCGGFMFNVKCRPRAILDIIKSGENFRISTTTKMPEQGTCQRCGYISSQVLSCVNTKYETIQYNASFQ